MKGKNEALLFAASTGISALVVAGYAWQNVLIGWVICGGIRWLVPAGKAILRKKEHALITVIGGIVLLTAAAVAAEEAFPQKSTFPFVSVGLLLLTLRSMVGVRENGRSVGRITGGVILVMLALILAFGVENVHWEELRVKEIGGREIVVSAAVGSLWWMGKEKSGGWKWFLASAFFAVGVSALTSGVLGSAYARETGAPMFRMVQTVEILGVLQRFEALAAVVMMLGAFSLMLFAGEKIRDSLPTVLPGVKKGYGIFGVLLIAFLLEWAFRSMGTEVQGRIGTIFWGLIPVFALWIVISGNLEKMLDNEKIE